MGMFTHVTGLFYVFLLLNLVETKIIQEADLNAGEKQHSNNVSTLNELNCKVRQSYSLGNWLGESLRFLAFIEHGERLSTSIGFKGQHMSLVYDKIIMSQEEITLYKIRNGKVNETKINKYLDTAGWIWIEISMINQQFILKYENTTALDYIVDQPVKELIVHGSSITVCKDGFPMWILEHGQSAKIPLEPSRQAVNQIGSRTYALTLQAENDFTPCIRVDGNTTCLESKNNKITLATTMKPSPLRAGIWDLHLEIVTGLINIYQKIDGKQENVISFLKQGIKSIEVSSNYSNFTVSLNAFVVAADIDVTTSYTDTQPNNGIKPEIIMIIGISIGIVLSGLVMGTVFFIKRRKWSFSAPKKENNDANGVLTDPETKQSSLDSRQLLIDKKYKNIYPDVNVPELKC